MIKHPLQHSWTLWYYEPDRSKDWTQNQNQVSTFNTVEDFWSLFNHIKQPSELKPGTDYSLFKQGIRPMWEDASNERGGAWYLSFNRQRLELDRYWIDTVSIFINFFYHIKIISYKLYCLSLHFHHSLPIQIRTISRPKILNCTTNYIDWIIGAVGIQKRIGTGWVEVTVNRIWVCWAYQTAIIERIYCFQNIVDDSSDRGCLSKGSSTI